MTYELVVQLARQAMITALLLSGPVLMVALGVGLLVSVLQTMTQVQEQTVAFVLKLFAAGLATFLLLPWLLSVAVDFGSRLVLSLPAMVP